MTTPSLEAEAVRLGIIPPKPDPFEWMNTAIYEPAPLPRAYGRSRSWFWPVFVTLALLFIVTGALVALSGWRL